jgi:hypothetical protein
MKALETTFLPTRAGAMKTGQIRQPDTYSTNSIRSPVTLAAASRPEARRARGLPSKPQDSGMVVTIDVIPFHFARNTAAEYFPKSP